LIPYSKIFSKVKAGIVSSIDKVEAPQELQAKIVKHLNKFDEKKIENSTTKSE
jgi:hypothetical protein